MDGTAVKDIESQLDTVKLVNDGLNKVPSFYNIIVRNRPQVHLFFLLFYLIFF